MIIPCIAGRTDSAPTISQSAQWGTIMPAAWSLMLAARARGIGSVFTCIHLMHEEEAAAALDIPYRRIMQAGLIPLAYTIGDRFRPATASRWTTSSTGTVGKRAPIADRMAFACVSLMYIRRGHD